MMTSSFGNAVRECGLSWCAQRVIAGSLSVLLCLGPLGLGTRAVAQTFDSTSDGSDGALNLTTVDPVTVLFDPVALGLDPDSDNIFHFTTINIGPGVTVRLPATLINGPVFWLASGAVQIDGIIDLNGEDGADDETVVFSALPPSIPGAGGFGGGVGATVESPAQPGFGPGGAAIGGRGGGAGYVTAQQGNIYGSALLVPLVGGSGGSGGSSASTSGGVFGGGSGGAGGGALLIASSVSISVDGTIQANGGGGGGAFVIAGGGGSGGSIRLVAPTIQGIGTLIVKAGPGGSSGLGLIGLIGSIGRGRLERFQDDFTGDLVGSWSKGAPFKLFLPMALAPTVRVVSITDAAGTKVMPFRPSGNFVVPDIIIDDTAPVDVAIEARNVPVGTVVQLHLYSEIEPIIIVDSPPLEGTLEVSTTIISTTIPFGFSSGFVRAVWRP